MGINNGISLILIMSTSINFLCGCKDNNNKENSRIKNQNILSIDSISKAENNYDFILNVRSSDTIKEEFIREYFFQIDKQEPFFLAINKNKIIAKYGIDSGGQVSILNPFTDNIYSELNLSVYAYEYVRNNGKGGFNPDATTFIRSNDGRIKIAITIGNIFFSIGDLNNSKKALLLNLNNKTKSIVISNFKKIFSSEYLLYVNDTLYDLNVLDDIQVFDNNIFLYSFNRKGQFMSFNFKDGQNLRIGIYNVSLFPLNNKIFFFDANQKRTILYNYDVVNNYSQKYILPFLVSRFFFAEDGFFVHCNELKDNKNSEEYDIYSFIKY